MHRRLQATFCVANLPKTRLALVKDMCATAIYRLTWFWKPLKVLFWLAILHLNAFCSAIESADLVKGRLEWGLFMDLPDDIKQTILDSLFDEDPQNINRLVASSFQGYRFALQHNYSSYSSLGTFRLPLNDTTICQRIAQNKTLLQTIRQAHITWQVYDECRFSSERLPNIKKLRVQIPSRRQMVSQFDRDRPGTAQRPSRSRMSLIDSSNEFLSCFGCCKRRRRFQGLQISREDGSVIDSRTCLEQTDTPFTFWSKLIEHYPSRVQVDIDNTDHVHQFMDLILNRDIDDKISKLGTALRTNRANLNVGDRHGTTALSYCFYYDLIAQEQRSSMNATACAETMLRHGANPNLRNEFGASPVHYASLVSSTSPLNVLLKHGGDPNNHASTGPMLTPIRLALETHAVQSSVDAHFRPLIEVMTNHDPAYNPAFSDLARWTSRYASLATGGSVPVHLLLQNGADLRLYSRNQTPMEYAIHARMNDLVILMLNRTIDLIPVGAVDKNGCNLLQQACRSASIAVITRLLELDLFDINAFTENCPQAIFESLLHQDRQAVFDLLVDAGAALNSVSLSRGPLFASVSLYYGFPIESLTRLLEAKPGISDVLYMRYNNNKATGLALVISRALHELHENPENRTGMVSCARALLELMKTPDNTTHSLNEPIMPYTAVHYHLLMLLLYRLQDAQLIAMHYKVIPPSILATVQLPLIDDDGLVLSKHGVLFCQKEYASMTPSHGDLYSKRILAQWSPSIYRFTTAVYVYWRLDEHETFPMSDEVRIVWLDLDPAVPSSAFEQSLRVTYPNAAVVFNYQEYFKSVRNEESH